MPKLIDYPRTSYAGAWELAEVVDDTGGKCAFETAARKLDRKVSGSFKAIIGSAVKFGLLTSKREVLTTTTLFKRIKHAYDKQEELLFHREAFLNPPLFTQICRKFRARELPIQMLDVMLIREFDVEEINAPGVAKAFVEGCQMVGLLNERNIMADIDALAAQKPPRRELASPPLPANSFRDTGQPASRADLLPENPAAPTTAPAAAETPTSSPTTPPAGPPRTASPATTHQAGPDAIASLFGLATGSDYALPDQSRPEAVSASPEVKPSPAPPVTPPPPPTAAEVRPAKIAGPVNPVHQANLLAKTILSATQPAATNPAPASGYQLQLSGPGVNTSLSISDEDDIDLAIALLNKIKRQLKEQ